MRALARSPRPVQRVAVRLPAVRRTARGLGFSFPTGYGAGACPINSDGTCGPGHDTDCRLIRECDDRTGTIHFEYALPGMRPNADINNYDASTGQTYYTDATGQRVATPAGIPVPTLKQEVDPWNNPILTLTRSPIVGSGGAAGGSGSGGSGGGSSSSTSGAGGGGGSGTGSGGGSTGLTLQDLIAALKGANNSTSTSSSPGLLGQKVSIFGRDVPVWALGLAGVVGAFALGGKR